MRLGHLYVFAAEETCEHYIVLTLSFKETLCINCKNFQNIQVKTPVGQITHNGVNELGFFVFS